METLLNTKIVRAAYQNSTVEFSADGRSIRMAPCHIFNFDLGLLDANPLRFNDSYAISLLAGRKL